MKTLSNFFYENNVDELVLREYTVTKPLPVRDGVVGPLQELSGANAGQVYSGSQHQYEFIENMRGNGWKEYFNENNVITYELK